MCAGISVLCLLPLGGYVALGYWSLPQADDFGRAAQAAKGVFTAIGFFYMRWGGRFSSDLLNEALLGSTLFPHHTNFYIIASVLLLQYSVFASLRRMRYATALVTLIDTATVFFFMPTSGSRQACSYFCINISWK